MNLFLHYGPSLTLESSNVGRAPLAQDKKKKTFLQSVLISDRSEVKSDYDTNYHMSRVMRKPKFCICENKDTDQLRGNREADQRLCFRYIDSTIPLLSKSEISSL